MSKLIPILLLLSVLSGVSGCHSTKRQTSFNVAARNVGTEGVDAVKIEFEGFGDAMGFLGPEGSGKQHSQFEGRWPKTARVTWRFEDDRAYAPDHEAVVTIPPRPTTGPEQDLTLWFELDGERVIVRAEKIDMSRTHQHIREVEARKRAEKSND